jgi:staphylococcal nuclease domain-containing protein 1
LPSNDDVPRDLGSAEIGGVDLSSELLRNGWAKLKEIKREPSEEDLKKRELENEAKAAGRGIWNPHGQTVNILTRPGPVWNTSSFAFIGTHGTSHDASGLPRICVGVEG